MDKPVKNDPKALRKSVQVGWGILTNAYIKGFLPGDPVIYQGKLKQVCVPGMNCYSCPGALGACPIGAMQAVFDGRQRHFAFYVVKDTGVTYTNIRAWDDFDSMFATIGTPTTYFVDSQGNIIGDPIVGASLNLYKTKMEELLSQAQ